MKNVYKGTGILFKILPCIFLLIFIGMICCSSCFASDATVETINIDEWDFSYEVSNPNNYYYFFVFYKNNDSEYCGIHYLLSTEPFICTEFKNGFYYFKTDGFVASGSSLKPFNTVKTSLDSLFSQSLNYVSENASVSAHSDFDMTTYRVNFDVKDTSGNVVFPKAPQEEQVELTLLPVVEQVEMKGILQEILEILPIVMIVVVSYLALRKALSLLFQLLHQS